MVPMMIIFHQKTKKEQADNLISEIFSFVWYLYVIKTKKEQANHFCNAQAHSKIYDHSTYTSIIIKKKLLFFFTVYKNEWKEYKF